MYSKTAVVVGQEQQEEIDNLISNLIKHEKALYHPETRKKLFIYDGFCSKRDCKMDTDEKVMKVLLPAGCFGEFLDLCQFDRVGKALVCFKHFFYQHQVEYLSTGEWPDQVRLLQKNENLKNYKSKPMPAPKPRKTKSGKDVVGFRLLKASLKDNAWVCNFHKFAQFKKQMKHCKLYFVCTIVVKKCFFFQNRYPDLLPAEQAEAQPEEVPQNEGSDNELPGDRSPLRNLSSSPISRPRKRQQIIIDSDESDNELPGDRSPLTKRQRTDSDIAGEEIAPKIHR
jgi:hypothetical protein